MRKKNKQEKKQLNRVYSKRDIFKIINKTVLFLFILFLPTQLGKHFFFDFSYLSGVRVDYLAPTLYLTDILALVLFALNSKEIVNFFKKPKMLFFLFFLALPFTTSLSKELSLYRYIKLLELIGVFVIARKHILRQKFVLYAFVLFAFAELSLVVLQFLNKHSLQGIFYLFGERSFTLSTPGIAKASLDGVEILRPYGSFSHPNSLAGFYLLLYFFVLSYKPFFSYPLLRNLLFFISTLLILFSFSKVAIFTFLLLILVYIFNRKRKENCTLCLVSKIGIISVVSLLFLRASTDPLSSMKRLELLQNSFSIVSKYPFFGVGLGNYLLAQNTFPSPYLNFINQPVHNIFLLLVSELGIVTFGFVFILFFKSVTKFLRKYPSILLAVFVTGFFDHYWVTLQQNALLAAFVLGNVAWED